MSITHQTVLGENGQPTAALIPWEEFQRIQEYLGEDESFSGVWESEINSRAREIDEGRVELTDGEDFIRRLRAL